MNPRRLQTVYAVCGGLIVGLAGAAFSLCAKPGWGRPQGAEGTGWIALALVIFGGWNPIRAALGAYLFFVFAGSRHLFPGMAAFGSRPGLPGGSVSVDDFYTAADLYRPKRIVYLWSLDKPRIKAVIKMLSSAAPAALGKPYRPES